VDFYNAGSYKDFHYTNVYAGFSTPQFATTNGDPNEALGSLWYHDHRFGFTAQNAYRGLLGNYLLFDALDTGDEGGPLFLPRIGANGPGDGDNVVPARVSTSRSSSPTRSSIRHRPASSSISSTPTGFSATSSWSTARSNPSSRSRRAAIVSV